MTPPLTSSRLGSVVKPKPSGPALCDRGCWKRASGTLADLDGVLGCAEAGRCRCRRAEILVDAALDVATVSEWPGRKAARGRPVVAWELPPLTPLTLAPAGDAAVLKKRSAARRSAAWRRSSLAVDGSDTADCGRGARLRLPLRLGAADDGRARRRDADDGRARRRAADTALPRATEIALPVATDAAAPCPSLSEPPMGPIVGDSAAFTPPLRRLCVLGPGASLLAGGSLEAVTSPPGASCAGPTRG